MLVCSRRAVGAHYWNRKFTSKSLGYDKLDSTGMSLGDVESVYAKLRMIANSQSWQKSRPKFIESNRLSKRWQSEAFRVSLTRRLLRFEIDACASAINSIPRSRPGVVPGWLIRGQT